MPASAQTELRTASSEPAQSRAAWIRLRLQEAIAAARGGRLDEAGRACESILDVEPENVAALSLSGEIALRRDDLGRALKRTRRSVELQPRNASLRCALGDALRAARQPLDAAAQFQRAWELAPDHPSASSRLIMTLMQECEVDRAITHMRSAMARDPFLHVALSYLLPLFESLASDRSRAPADQATGDIHPRWALACHVWRHAINTLQRMADPIGQSGRSAEPEASCASIFGELAALHTARKRNAEALACMRALLAIEPDNSSAQHMVASLSGTRLERASAEYTADLFDAVAARFDEQLTEQLGYSVPQQLAALALRSGAAPPQGWDVVDLGCGTGLSGMALKEHARSLVGVDLSAGMLARARARGLYARLEQADLIEFLTREPEGSCDLVFAADVFCYLGGLDAIFAAVPRIMRPGALLVFSVESLEKASLAAEAQRAQSHSVTVSGRFAHRRTYIEDLASASRLSVAGCTAAVLRAEHAGEIAGWLFALRKL